MHYKRKSISIRPISSEIMLKNLAVSFLKLMGPTHGISVAHGNTAGAGVTLRHSTKEGRQNGNWNSRDSPDEYPQPDGFY